VLGVSILILSPFLQFFQLDFGTGWCFLFLNIHGYIQYFKNCKNGDKIKIDTPNTKGGKSIDGIIYNQFLAPRIRLY
jgi:hypothetical protein